MSATKRTKRAVFVKTRRVEHPVSLDEARMRLENWSKTHPGLHSASRLAEVIWPDAKFIAPQGAGAAASRVLKKLGYQWTSTRNPEAWGWKI